MFKMINRLFTRFDAWLFKTDCPHCLKKRANGDAKAICIDHQNWL